MIEWASQQTDRVREPLAERQEKTWEMSKQIIINIPELVVIPTELGAHGDSGRAETIQQGGR